MDGRAQSFGTRMLTITYASLRDQILFKISWTQTVSKLYFVTLLIKNKFNFKLNPGGSLMVFMSFSKGCKYHKTIIL